MFHEITRRRARPQALEIADSKVPFRTSSLGLRSYHHLKHNGESERMAR